MINLMLVNKEHGLDKDYVPEKLYTCDNNKNNFHRFLNPTLKPQVSLEMVESFKELKNRAMIEQNYDIVIDSGYRSYEYQQNIWDNCLINNYDLLKKEKPSLSIEQLVEEAKKMTDSYVARAGHSEHQTGLAFDFSFFKNGELVETVKDSCESEWMYYNAYKFGFILRYPLGKEIITGYNYEPWHYRFVGDVSSEFFVNGEYITLEEYLNNKTLSLTKK